jgi:hypothetical protein
MTFYAKFTTKKNILTIISDCGLKYVAIIVTFLLVLDSGRTRQVILPNSGFELQSIFWREYQPTWNKKKHQ